MTLTRITKKEYGVEIYLSYATSNNFTGKPVYVENAGCFLHPDAAVKLKRASELANAMGYKLKIFDAYRPQEVQEMLWAHTPDPEFLADPSKGSPHSRGVAIDLTLMDEKGVELDMGTAFDAFTPLSHHGNTEINISAQKNRYLLLGLMSAAGWDFYMNEWWHYQLFNSKTYPVLHDSSAGTGMIQTLTDSLRIGHAH